MSARFALPLLALFAAPLGAQEPSDAEDAPSLKVFDEVWGKFETQFYDRTMHGKDWEALRQKYLPLAKEAATKQKLHYVTQLMLGELKASHAAMIEEDVYLAHYFQMSKAKPVPYWGVTVVESENPAGLFVRSVVPGSPAAAAGIVRGDKLLAIDDEPAAMDDLAPELWDAGLGDPRPFRLSVPKVDEQLTLELEREPRGDNWGVYRVTLTARPWSQMEGMLASRHVEERYGLKIGYLHLHNFLMLEVADTIANFLVDLEDADGLILDLRGPGGLESVVEKVEAYLDPLSADCLWGKPTVALIDGRTRSAKELFAWRFRQRGLGTLVGSRTAGAVLGSTFVDLSDGSRVLVPAMDMRASSGGVVLEGRGITPDVEVENPLAYAQGRDYVKERGFDVLFAQLLREQRRGKRHGWY